MNFWNLDFYDASLKQKYFANTKAQSLLKHIKPCIHLAAHTTAVVGPCGADTFVCPSVRPSVRPSKTSPSFLAARSKTGLGIQK